jgi:hypothetical protein
MTKCPTNYGIDYPGGNSECLTTCEAWTAGTEGMSSGDNIECRIYHANGSAADNDVHCGEAQKVPTTGCQ